MGEEAKKAAEKAKKEAEEAAAKAKKEQEAEEAAEKAKKEKEAKEAAEKARKEKEAKDAAERAKKEEEARKAAEKAKKEQEAKEAAAKAKKEQEAKEAAEKARKEKEAKEAADKARRAKEAEEAAEKAKKEQEAKEAAEKAKKEEEEEEAAKAERERIRDHYAEKQRKQQEEQEKILIQPANVSLRGRKAGPVDEDDIEPISADMSYQESPEEKDSKVQDVVRHLLKEVKITINLKTLKHHIDHIFMIRLGTMLKAGTLTFDKYVRIKNQDRRRIKELIGHTTAQEYNENDDVFGTLDKALKLGGIRTKSEDDTAIGEQVALLLKQTRVPVSQKDFIYHMNKIITIILGMMLHVGVLTFTKFNQMKITHRADMDEMLDSHYDSHSDVFGVLERAVERHGHAAPSQRRKSAENLNVKRVQDRERRRGSEDNIMRRKDEMLEGWEGGERPEDSSMQKLGRMLDKGSLSKDKLKRPGIDNVRDAVQPVGDGKTSSRGGSRRESYDTMI